MTELNKQSVQTIQSEINDILTPLQEKYGITISLGTIHWSKDELRTKLTARIGKATPKLSKDSFSVGETVKMNHKSIDPNNQFIIEKINNKNIKVRSLDGGGRYNVNPSFLIKIS